MKNKSEILARRFEEVFLNGTWVANTNYQKALTDLSFDQAIQKVSDLNTIYALTYHIHYYVRGVLQVFQGGELTIRDKFSFDLPTAPSEEAWIELRSILFEDAQKFARTVRNLSDEQLYEGFVKPEYGTVERNIDGMIEHAYYHLGQISLIRKLILKSG